MSYVRTKRINNSPYLYEQESYRTGKKVNTRHVRYIGGVGSSSSKSLGTTTNQQERLDDPKVDLPNDLPDSFKKLPIERQNEILMTREARRRLFYHEVDQQLMTPKERKQSIKAVERLYNSGIDTKSYHFKEGKYSEERKMLHEDIGDKFLNKPKSFAPKGKKPTVIFLGGPPGSGKSEVILKGLNVNEDEFVILDNDEIKQKLPEYKGYNANLTHAEASDIYDNVRDRAVLENRNIILDATLKSTEKAIKQVKLFQELGYDVKLYATNNDTGKTVRSATRRAIKKGRYVPIEYIVKNGEKINQSVQKVAPYADEYKVYDVSNYPEPPTVLMEGKNQFVSTKT